MYLLQFWYNKFYIIFENEEKLAQYIFPKMVMLHEVKNIWQ